MVVVLLVLLLVLWLVLLLLLQCCRGLTLVELDKGVALYREGEPGDSFDCIITGSIAVLEGDTEVAVLHRPATFGERALEEDGGKRTATCISKTGVHAFCYDARGINRPFSTTRD